MWPFTTRRIFGNRWWAIAFVVFVCWQVVDLFGDPPATANTTTANNTVATDISGASVDDAQMHEMVDTLNRLENAN
jgi:hypothetical protein